MNPSVRLLLLPALCAIALGACGSARPAAMTVPSAPGASQRPAGAQSDGLTAWRAAVACARQHGMPGLPDPVIGADGRVSLPGYARIPTPPPAVKSACAAQIRAIQSTGSTDATESASDISALLRVAACLRTHGYPHWPDPNGRGEFYVRSADAGTPAQFSRAMAACNSLFPPSGWHLRVTPSGQ
jgi:hypothetical protein